MSIAAVNGPSATTLSGDAAAIEALAAELTRRGVFNRVLHVDVAYHSHHMDPLQTALEASLRTVRPSAPRIALYSTVTGDLVRDAVHDAEDLVPGTSAGPSCSVARSNG